MHKLIKISLILCLTWILIIASLIILNRCCNVKITIAVYGLGEAYRNMIVRQYNGSEWLQICNITSDGEEFLILKEQPIDFIVQVLLDHDYAVSASEALANTNLTFAIRYNANTTYVTGWQEIELTNATNAISYDSDTYWLVTKCGNWTSNLPQEGVTYQATSNYKANY